MHEILGPAVLKIKPDVSYDIGPAPAHDGDMDAIVNAKEFDALFKSRVKQARKQAGLTQREVAGLLRIEQDKYKQYETRSMMPHNLIPQFCLACHVHLDWLFTGRVERRRGSVTSLRLYRGN